MRCSTLGDVLAVEEMWQKPRTIPLRRRRAAVLGLILIFESGRWWWG